MKIINLWKFDQSKDTKSAKTRVQTALLFQVINPIRTLRFDGKKILALDLERKRSQIAIFFAPAELHKQKSLHIHIPKKKKKQDSCKSTWGSEDTLCTGQTGNTAILDQPEPPRA